ncbi:hypothetical protein SAMN06269185_2449 [Natronoarchaeum philippinense]|uniref:Uncharacterized protein n=1 Tax=Natronoarchaeum philippinense TaxID=558529 RepID=A0A285P0N8_NATPI|nr:hypothetical protein SAMN06269185_2449 [Natronoarchaeum philippinense]
MKNGYDLPANAPGQYMPLRTSDPLPKGTPAGAYRMQER